MPDKGKDRRTPEEVAAHYAAKAERVEKKYAAKAARVEKKYKDKEKRATRAKAKQLHRKAIGTAKDRYTPGYMENYRPWDT